MLRHSHCKWLAKVLLSKATHIFLDSMISISRILQFPQFYIQSKVVPIKVQNREFTVCYTAPWPQTYANHY